MTDPYNIGANRVRPSAAGTVAILIAFILCTATEILRFVLPMPGIRADDIFKDWAHLLVAGIFGAALMSGILGGRYTAALYFMFGGLVVAEVVAFGISFFK